MRNRQVKAAHVSEEAVFEDTASGVQPVDYGVCVLLHGRGEDDEGVPSGDLAQVNMRKEWG